MRSVSGRRLVTAMLFGILGAVVAIALDAAISFLRKDWTNPIGIALVTGVAALSGIVPLLRRETPRPVTAPGPAPQPVPPAPHPYGHPSPVPSPRPVRHRVPVLVGVLVLVLFCGGGVAAATYGARYLGGLITGEESGVDVLAEERSATAGALTLTVHSVTLTSHFTRVEMSATNSGDMSLQLPIFKTCLLIVPADGTTLEADDFRSSWNQEIPVGQTVSGTVNFARLASGVDRINISFSQIYGQFGETSITVADIPLVRR